MRLATGVASGVVHGQAARAQIVYSAIMTIGRGLMMAPAMTATVAAVRAQPEATVSSIRPSVDNEPGMRVRPLPNGSLFGAEGAADRPAVGDRTVTARTRVSVEAGLKTVLRPASTPPLRQLVGPREGAE